MRMPGASTTPTTYWIALIALVAGCGGSGRGPTGFVGGADAGGAARDLSATGSGADLAGTGPRDLATSPGREDLAVPPAPPDLAVGRDLATPPADLAVGNCSLRVNEVLSGTVGSAAEEWVEIYNPCGAAVPLTGWRLAYRSANNVNALGGADSQTLYTWVNGSLGAHGYLVLGGANYAGATDGTMASGVATNGSVGLRDPNGALVDSVAWGTIMQGNAFVETTAANAAPVAASPGATIGRIPDGSDTNDNSVDFKMTAAPTPRAANR